MTAAMPVPGDRHPGFTAQPGRCWAMIFSKQMQACHCRATPTVTGRWRSPRGDRWFIIYSCYTATLRV